MLGQLQNIEGDICSLQISSLENISGDYTGKPFLIKNVSDESQEVEIMLANNYDWITTIIEPGWNPEICTGIKNAQNIQIGR